MGTIVDLQTFLNATDSELEQHRKEWKEERKRNIVPEVQISTTLRELLRPYFKLFPEVRLSYPETQNILKIDYLAFPNEEIDFPYQLFGIEVKHKSKYDGIGNFNKALKQAIDYTKCKIVDDRFPEFYNRILGEVYIFPPPARYKESEFSNNMYGGSERLAGLFHVGLIYLDRLGKPQFRMSMARQWDPTYSKSAVEFKNRRVGTVNSRIAETLDISLQNLGGFGGVTKKPSDGKSLLDDL